MDYLGEELSGAQTLDSQNSTHPIEIPVKNPEQIDEIFDEISYEKGCAVILMVASYLGQEIFREGQHQYLQHYKFSNAETIDLWNALESYSNKPINDMMSRYTKYDGYPLVDFTVDDDKSNEALSSITVSQKRFLLVPNSSMDTNKKLWHIPLECKYADGTVAINKTLIHDEITRQNITNSNSKYRYMLCNGDLVGFYRVKYPNEWYTMIINDYNLLNNTNDDEIKKSYSYLLDEKVKYGQLRDILALTKSGLLQPSIMIQLTISIATIEKSSMYIWNSIFENLLCVYTTQKGYNDASIDNIILSQRIKVKEQILLQCNTYNIKLDSTFWCRTSEENEENDELSRLRVAIAYGQGNFDDKESYIICKKQLQEYSSNNSKISFYPEIRGMLYKMAVKEDSINNYKKILYLYDNTIMSEEHVRQLRSLTWIDDKNIINTILNDIILESLQSKNNTIKLLNQPVRSQDIPSFISSFNTNHNMNKYVWDWVCKNWDTVFLPRYKNNSGIRRIVNVISNFSTIDESNQVKEFFKTHEYQGAELLIKQLLEKIDSNILWNKYVYDDITNLRAIFN